MTAPAIAETPTDPMEATIAATMGAVDPAELGQPDLPAVTRERGPDGKFLSQTPAQEDAAVVETGASTPEGVEEVAIEIPEGYTAVQAVPADKLNGVSVFDAEGEVVAPALTWKLTAAGKERELSTDQLVSYAQMGVYNHDREQRAEQATQQARHSTERALASEQQVRQRDTQIEQLLTDPDFLIRAITEYGKLNTPEARAERERQAFTAERETFQVQQMSQEAQRYLDGEIAPALETIAGALPHVSREELAARLFLSLDQFRVKGVLGPQARTKGADGLTPADQAILHDLVPWAKQLNAHRAESQAKPLADARAAEAKAKKDAEAAKAASQRTKRQQSAGMKPGAPGSASPNQKPTIRSQKDAESTVIGRTLQAVRSG